MFSRGGGMGGGIKRLFGGGGQGSGRGGVGGANLKNSEKPKNCQKGGYFIL